MKCAVCGRLAVALWPGPLCRVHHREVMDEMNDDGPEPLGDKDFRGDDPEVTPPV